MPFRIALKQVVISLHIYRHRSLLDWPVKHFGKLAGSLDGDQRLRAVGWSLNLSRQQSSSCQDFTGGSKPSFKQDQNLALRFDPPAFELAERFPGSSKGNGGVWIVMTSHW